MTDPLEQGEWTTLEAELRQALQHQRAAYEQMQEAQRALDEVVARAKKLSGDAPQPSAPADEAGAEG
jgi:hypothetical protein